MFAERETLPKRIRQFSQKLIAFPLVCLLAGLLIRRLRKVLLAAALAGLAYAATQFNPSSLVLAHLLTWGVPGLLGVVFIWRVVIRRASIDRPAVEHASMATAAWALVALLGIGGCAATQTTAPLPDGDATQIMKRVD